MLLFLSLIHSLNKNPLDVHCSLGTGLGAKVRERKRGGKIWDSESRAKARHLKNLYKQGMLGKNKYLGFWKHNRGRDLLLRGGPEKPPQEMTSQFRQGVINSFYRGKGEVGGQRVFPAECQYIPKQLQGGDVERMVGVWGEQMRWQRQVGRARAGKGKHASDAGQIKECGLYPAGSGEPMKVLLGKYLRGCNGVEGQECMQDEGLDYTEEG